MSISPQQTQITFKPLAPEDLPLLYTWFKKTHVSKWWPTPERHEDFFEKFLTRIRTKKCFPFLIFANAIPIGYIQYYHIDKPSERQPDHWLPELPETTIGTDQFIGEEAYLGKGYGTLMIKEFITYLFSTLEPTINMIIVDPQPENIAAIKCYEKIGFTHMGTYKNPWGLAVLMKYTKDR